MAFSEHLAGLCMTFFFFVSGFSADGCDLLALPTEPSPLRMERGIWAAWQRKLVRAVHFSCVCSHLNLSPCLNLRLKFILCDERDAEQAASAHPCLRAA